MGITLVYVPCYFSIKLAFTFKIYLGITVTFLSEYRDYDFRSNSLQRPIMDCRRKQLLGGIKEVILKNNQTQVCRRMKKQGIKFKASFWVFSEHGASRRKAQNVKKLKEL